MLSKKLKFLFYMYAIGGHVPGAQADKPVCHRNWHTFSKIWETAIPPKLVANPEPSIRGTFHIQRYESYDALEAKNIRNHCVFYGKMRSNM